MGIVRTRDPLPRVDKGVWSAESVYGFKWIRDQIAGNEDDDDEEMQSVASSGDEAAARPKTTLDDEDSEDGKHLIHFFLPLRGV